MLLEARTAWLKLAYKRGFSSSSHWKVGFKHSKSQGFKRQHQCPPPHSAVFSSVGSILVWLFSLWDQYDWWTASPGFYPIFSIFPFLGMESHGFCLALLPLAALKDREWVGTVLRLAGLGSHAQPWSCCQWLHWAEGVVLEGVVL